MRSLAVVISARSDPQRVRYHVAMRSPLLRALGLNLLVGCSGPQPDTTPSTASPNEPARAEPAKREPARPEPDDAIPESTSPPSTKTTPVTLGRDHRSFVACTTDAECGWDDACKPTRCVEVTPPRTCKDSAPPPGTCGCIEGACTTRPKVAPAPSGTCEVRGCMVDRAAGRCVADTGGVPEGIRATPGVNTGPSCDCTDPTKGCTFSWFDAVACKDDRDCWIDPSPRTHPVARPKALRSRDFRPCKDGEVAPKCGPAGTCILGPAYTC